MSLRPRVASLVVAVVGAVLAGGCVSAEVDTIPPPPPRPSTTTTTVIDFSGIGLPAVPGRTTTTVAAGPGPYALTGTVVGPDGPVEAAVVRAERLVDDAVATVEAVTNPDGTFTIPEILGGRYRVRAWRAPDLALITPEIFFLDNTSERVLQLGLTRYAGLTVKTAVAPNPPEVDRPVNLAVQVAQRTVDDQGVVRAEPVPDADVELFGSGDWQLQSGNPAITGSDGVARFRAVCRRAGEQPLSVVVGDSASFPLDIPACAVPPPDPEEVEPEPPSTTSTSTGGGASTTSTTSRGAGTSTTSTTR